MSNKELKTAYDSAAENYLFTRTKSRGLTGFQNREIEQPTMLKLVPRTLKNKKLLDLGCGPGIHLIEYVKRGAVCTGIDLSSEMVNLARQRCPKASLSAGNVEHLNFKTDSFDIVTSSLVLDHIKNLKNAVKEIKRVLKKRGKLIISVGHPLTFMFRESNGKFLPSNSYFDEKKMYYNISNAGKIFPGYPKTMENFLKPFLENGFVLKKLLENSPKKSWRKKYPDLYEVNFKIPIFCFFEWEKG